MWTEVNNKNTLYLYTLLKLQNTLEYTILFNLIMTLWFRLLSPSFYNLKTPETQKGMVTSSN